MSDILSQGGEPGPRRKWPRWIAAAVVAALLVLVLVEHLPQHAAPRRHPAARGSLPISVTTARPANAGTRQRRTRAQSLSPFTQTGLARISLP